MATENFKGDQDGFCSLCWAWTRGAWLDDREIDCGWGSRHDQRHFRWLRPRHPVKEREGLVCDDCIDALLAAGAIEFSHEDRSPPIDPELLVLFEQEPDFPFSISGPPAPRREAQRDERSRRAQLRRRDTRPPSRSR